MDMNKDDEQREDQDRSPGWQKNNHSNAAAHCTAATASYFGFGSNVSMSYRSGFPLSGYYEFGNGCFNVTGNKINTGVDPG
jgi:hypothetical protein